MVRPFRIGIWCDYGVTLTPTEGIGVFVWNLIGGLMELDEPLEVVVQVSPGSQRLFEPLRSRFKGRLQIVPPIWPTISGWPFPTRVIQAGIRFIAYIWRKSKGLNRRIEYWREKSFTEKSSARITATYNGFFNYLDFVKNNLHRAFAGCTIELNRFSSFRKILGQWEATFNSLIACHHAGCDVWLIPSVRFRIPLTFPSVLVIHDLVHVHYPDSVPDHVRWELEKVVPARAGEATLCACMSAFIRDADLRGVLGLPLEKIRMIRAAPPQDFPEITKAEAIRLKPARLTRPYLFYPGAFRSYKNHVALIEALHLLRARMGEDSFDLVFTGIRGLPISLSQKINALRLKDRIHVLGCVDRRTLAATYQNAFATIVPSFYEQGSFPIYEALHGGCPVACSEIPPLVEQCKAMGDAMIYFNPHEPETIARAILRIQNDRESILTRQQSAKPLLWQRTWRDVARDWLSVFHEAIELHHALELKNCA